MKPLFLSVAAGGLLAVSLPPYNWGWVAWFAVTPLLLAASGRRRLEAFGLGIIAGVFCGIVHVGWHHDANGLRYAYLPFICLSFLLGLVASVGASALSTKNSTPDTQRSFCSVLIIAAAAVAFEWLSLLSPLPLNLAITQYQFVPLLQLSALTGIWGVSFLFWWVNAAVADAVLQRAWRSVPVWGGVAALLIVVVGGHLWLSREESRSGAPRLRAAAIQDFSSLEAGSVADVGSLEREGPDRDAMTRQAVEQGARLVVWSEGCLGGAFTPEDPAPASRMPDPTRDLTQELGIFLVVGYTERGDPRPFNCAGIVSPDRSLIGIHRKRHLFLGERQSVQPGTDTRAFDTPLGRIGMAICFDTNYPDVTRELASDGAQIVAMPNFDPPTPRGILHRLHAALLPFRAAENQVAFVRSDSNGLSQIIAPSGRILAQGPLYAPAVLVETVSLGAGKGTFYTRAGDWFPVGCMVLALVLLLPRRRRGTTEERKKRGKEERKRG